MAVAGQLGLLRGKNANDAIEAMMLAWHQNVAYVAPNVSDLCHIRTYWNFSTGYVCPPSSGSQRTVALRI